MSVKETGGISINMDANRGAFFVGVDRIPDAGSPEEDQLFRRTRRIDPRITRQRFDAYISDRRNQREGLLRRIYYEEDLADLNPVGGQLPPAPGFSSIG